MDVAPQSARDQAVARRNFTIFAVVSTVAMTLFVIAALLFIAGG